MSIKKNDCIVFFGDSITDAGKNRIEGEGPLLCNPYGNGYVSLVFGYLRSKYPQYHLRIVNQGIGGNRTWDLLERYEQNVLNLKPNHLFIMIGVNDAWRPLDFPDIPGLITTTKQYEQNLEKLITDSLKNNINVTILSPFMIDYDHSDPLLKVLDEYILVCEKLASKYQLAYINMQVLFEKLLEDITVYEISSDRIHPNITGHMLIARAVIDLIEKQIEK